MRAFVFRYLHLGDKLASCLVLQSMADKMGSKIKVGGCESIKSLIDGIGLGMLEWTESLAPMEKTLRLMDVFGFLSEARIPFFTTPSFAVDFEPPKIDRIRLPKLEVAKAEVTLFQFDSRSTNENKKRLSRRESMRFIRSKAKFKPIGVGGVDTKRELPFEYNLGGLRHVINLIKSASQFVGVDSGMSHIAGVFGVPSDICLMHTERSDVLMVERFYKECYPNTVCSHDFSNGWRRMPRLKIF